MIIIPFLVIFHFFSLKITRRKALAFANFEAIERFAHSRILSKNLTLLILRMAVFTLLVLAISGTSYTYFGQITEMNFIIAIDASGSMLATDFSPNRLEAAKNAAIDFVDTLPFETKIGIVSFSGASFIKERPTNNILKVKNAISSIQTELIAGTGIGEVIITSTNLLSAENPPSSIILITDGQNNIGSSIEESVAYAKSHNIIINTIGIGTEEGGKFENFNETIISKVNFEDLQYIAQETNGKSYLVSDYDSMDNAYLDIANIKKGSKEVSLSQYLMLLGIFILVIEWVLLNTKYRTIP